MPIDRNNAQYITGAIYKPTQTSAPGVWDLDDQANNTAKNLWPLPPQAVQRSLRFNSADSAYLNRTPAVAGNRRTYTWSGWVKISTLADQVLFNAQANSSNGTQRSMITLASSGSLYANTDNLNTAMIWTVSSNNLLRDLGAWYHIVVAVDTTQGTTANRVRMYINGIEVSYASSTYPSQNYDDAINSTVSHYLAYEQHPAQSTKRFNGYMAEVNFVDGQQLTPTSFGETDQQTGVWIPKRYTGTYGTNGFRLSFANNSSTTALGYDSSGQGNNWTTNNFSITPGVGNDVFVDVPSLYNTDTGLGGEVLGNYCTWNALDKDTNVTLANGNLDLTAYNQGVYATWSLTSGKWYYELTLIDPYNGGGSINFWGYHGLIGVQRSAAGLNVSSFSGIYCNTDTADNNTPGIYQLGTRILAYTTFANSDIIGLAADIDNKTLTIYRNGTVIRSNITLANISTFYIWSGMNGTSGDPGTTSVNFGQRPFVYTAPNGFKALCTTNLPAPAIGQTSSNQADNHFAVVTYTGNGGTQTISTLDFQPDLVWIKRRDSNWSHAVYDSIRGAGSLKALSTNAADAEGVFNADTTYGYLSSFNNNGFTVINGSTGGYTNLNNATYVAWCWNAGGSTVTNTSGTITSQVRANKAAGFSVVTYTGNGVSYPTGATIGHGLVTAPQFIIAKSRDATGSWNCYHVSVATGNRIDLNSTAAATGDAGVWNSVAPTSTVFSIGNTGNSNISGRTYVAYCFAAVPGFSAFGSYTGNGSSDGPFVYLGFRPRWLLIKNITFSPTNWILHDLARAPTNPDGNLLLPDQSGAEAINSAVDYVDFLANGFKVRGNGEAQNRSASTHIYAAFAETPARLSTAR